MSTTYSFESNIKIKCGNLFDKIGGRAYLPSTIDFFLFLSMNMNSMHCI